MSSLRSGKHKRKGGGGTVHADHPAPAPQHTELAKLLGNRSRALLAFEDSGFDSAAFLSAYFAPLSEKAIDNARTDLGALLATCTDEVESVVQQHHRRFLEACSGVEALEDQVALLRNYTNGLTALVGSIKAGLRTAGDGSGSGSKAARASRSLAQPPQSPLSSEAGGFDAPGGGGHHHHYPGASSSSSPGVMGQIEASLEMLLQELDLAAAARDLPSAVAWLEVADSVAGLLDRDASSLVMEVDDFPGWRHSYDAAVGLRKQQLVFALQQQLADANASAPEIGAAAAALTDLVGEGPALQAMLNCYSHKIRLSQALLLKQHTAGSDPNSLEFAGRLVQRTLLVLGGAGDALVATFGVSQRTLGSLFTVWATREAHGCAGMLRQHVLAPTAAASTGLSTAVQVVGLVLVLCAMLEDSHSISLTPTMTSELWPSIDTALRRHLKRVTDELRMAAAEEVHSLVVGCLSTQQQQQQQQGHGALAGLPIQVPSLVCCASLAAEVSSLAQLLCPIANPQLAASLRKGLLDLFHALTQTITFTMKSHICDAPSAAALSGLLPGVMEGLAGVIEEGLPAGVAGFEAGGGPVIDAKALDRGLNTMFKEVTAAARAARAAAAAAAGGGGGGGGKGAAAAAAATAASET